MITPTFLVLALTIIALALVLTKVEDPIGCVVFILLIIAGIMVAV